MTPDRLLGQQEQSVQLLTQLLDADPDGGSPTVVIQGSRTAMRLLSDLLAAIADHPTDVHLDPRGSGSFHFDPESSVGLYIECIET